MFFIYEDGVGVYARVGMCSDVYGKSFVFRYTDILISVVDKYEKKIRDNNKYHIY